jgi:integrase
VENSWIVTKPSALISWQPKIDLRLASQPQNDDCYILAENDVEAIQLWIQQFKDTPTTHRAYQKEAERLLLWCTFEKGLAIGELKAEYFEEYFNFLQNPPKNWLGSKKELRAERYTINWRPLAAPLKKTSLLFAVRVINSLMNYLVDAKYLKSNPMKLIKKYRDLSIDYEEQKYKVWARMLEVDEWQAVQEALQNLPENNSKAQQYKTRTQLLFALLYLLGLRIHEVANATWGSFRKLNGNWWFFVKGKGGKLGHVPVNDQLLSMIKIYRLSLNKLPLPEEDELEAVLISQKTKKPLSVRQLFSNVKEIGQVAAEKFKDNPQKRQKLASLSPHWLRHLSASHQDLVGITGTMIQANHRHESYTTTQIYLHAPDELRAQEMQKMYMTINPKLYSKPAEDVTTKIVLSLIGGSLGGTDSLIRLLTAVENNILSDFSWSRVGALIEMEDIINKYEEIKSFKLPLEVSYELAGSIDGERLKYLKTAILREAEIRLFDCKVQYAARPDFDITLLMDHPCGF